MPWWNGNAMASGVDEEIASKDGFAEKIDRLAELVVKRYRDDRVPPGVCAIFRAGRQYGIKQGVNSGWRVLLERKIDEALAKMGVDLSVADVGLVVDIRFEDDRKNGAPSMALMVDVDQNEPLAALRQAPLVDMDLVPRVHAPTPTAASLGRFGRRVEGAAAEALMRGRKTTPPAIATVAWRAELKAESSADLKRKLEEEALAAAERALAAARAQAAKNRPGAAFAPDDLPTAAELAPAVTVESGKSKGLRMTVTVAEPEPADSDGPGAEAAQSLEEFFSGLSIQDLARGGYLAPRGPRIVWEANGKPAIAARDAMATGDRDALTTALHKVADIVILRDSLGIEPPPMRVLFRFGPADSDINQLLIGWPRFVEQEIDRALAAKGRADLRAADLGLIVEPLPLPAQDFQGEPRVQLEVDQRPRARLAELRSAAELNLDLVQRGGANLKLTLYSLARVARRAEGLFEEAQRRGGELRMEGPVTVSIVRNAPMSEASRTSLRNQMEKWLLVGAERGLRAARVKAERRELVSSDADRLPSSMTRLLPQVLVEDDIPREFVRNITKLPVRVRFGGPAPVPALVPLPAKLPVGDEVGQVVRLDHAEAEGLDAVGWVGGEFGVDAHGTGVLGADSAGRLAEFAVRWGKRFEEFAKAGLEWGETRVDVGHRGGRREVGNRLFGLVEGALRAEAVRRLPAIRVVRGGEVTLEDLGFGFTRVWHPAEGNAASVLESGWFGVKVSAPSGRTVAETEELREFRLLTAAERRSGFTPFERWLVRRMAAGFARRLYHDRAKALFVLELSPDRRGPLARTQGATARHAEELLVRERQVRALIWDEVAAAYAERPRRLGEEALPVEEVMSTFVLFRPVRGSAGSVHAQLRVENLGMPARGERPLRGRALGEVEQPPAEAVRPPAEAAQSPEEPVAPPAEDAGDALLRDTAWVEEVEAWARRAEELDWDWEMQVLETDRGEGAIGSDDLFGMDDFGPDYFGSDYFGAGGLEADDAGGIAEGSGEPLEAPPGATAGGNGRVTSEVPEDVARPRGEGVGWMAHLVVPEEFVWAGLGEGTERALAAAGHGGYQRGRVKPWAREGEPAERSAFEVQRVLGEDGAARAVVTLRLDVGPVSGEGAAERAAEWADLVRRVDWLVNRPGLLLSNGDVLVVRLVRADLSPYEDQPEDEKPLVHHEVVWASEGDISQTVWRWGSGWAKVHELGHMLGLPHSAVAGTLMGPGTVAGPDGTEQQYRGELRIPSWDLDILSQHIGDVPVIPSGGRTAEETENASLGARYRGLLTMLGRHLEVLPASWGERVRAEWAVLSGELGVGPSRMSLSKLTADQLRQRCAQVEELVRVARAERAGQLAEAIAEAQEEAADGESPLVFYPMGIPGGATSRPDVRLGFELEVELETPETKALNENESGLDVVDRQVAAWRSSLLAALRDGKYIPATQQRLFAKHEEDEIAAAHAAGKWAGVLENMCPHGLELVSSILRPGRDPGAWARLDQMLVVVRDSATKFKGGEAVARTGGHVNVSFAGSPLSAEEKVRLGRLNKVFESVLYRLFNHPGGSRQRRTGMVGPNPVPVEPGAAEAAGEVGLLLSRDKDDAINFGHPKSDFRSYREFRAPAGAVWPAEWQVHAEVCALLELAARDSSIDSALDRLMAEPLLLGRSPADLPELLSLLELLPVGAKAQEQIAQLFVWTSPWMDTGANDSGRRTQTISLPFGGLYFPQPGDSVTDAVAMARSLPGFLHQEGSRLDLVVARATSGRDEIQLWNGSALTDDELEDLFVSRRILSDRPAAFLVTRGASAGWLKRFVPSFEFPVFVTRSDWFALPDRRIVAGRAAPGPDGQVRIEPDPMGWLRYPARLELPDDQDWDDPVPAVPTGEADLATALARFGYRQVADSFQMRDAVLRRQRVTGPRPPGGREPGAPWPGPGPAALPPRLAAVAEDGRGTLDFETDGAGPGLRHGSDLGADRVFDDEPGITRGLTTDNGESSDTDTGSEKGKEREVAVQPPGPARAGGRDNGSSSGPVAAPGQRGGQESGEEVVVPGAGSASATGPVPQASSEAADRVAGRAGKVRSLAREGGLGSGSGRGVGAPRDGTGRAKQGGVSESLPGAEPPPSAPGPAEVLAEGVRASEVRTVQVRDRTGRVVTFFPLDGDEESVLRSAAGHGAGTAEAHTVGLHRGGDGRFEVATADGRRVLLDGRGAGLLLAAKGAWPAGAGAPTIALYTCLLDDSAEDGPVPELTALVRDLGGQVLLPPAGSYRIEIRADGTVRHLAKDEEAAPGAVVFGPRDPASAAPSSASRPTSAGSASRGSSGPATRAWGLFGDPSAWVPGAGLSELAQRVLAEHESRLGAWMAQPPGQADAEEFVRLWADPVLAALRAELQQEVDQARGRGPGERAPASQEVQGAMREWSQWRSELGSGAAADGLAYELSEEKRNSMAEALFPGQPDRQAMLLADGSLSRALCRLIEARHPDWERDPTAARELARQLWEEFERLGREVDVPASVALDRAFVARWVPAVEAERARAARLRRDSERWEAAERMVAEVLGQDRGGESARAMVSLHETAAAQWLSQETGGADRRDRFDAWWNAPVLAEMRSALAGSVPAASARAVEAFRELSRSWWRRLSAGADAVARTRAVDTAAGSRAEEAAYWRHRAADRLGYLVPAPPLTGRAARLRLRLQQALVDRLAWRLQQTEQQRQIGAGTQGDEYMGFVQGEISALLAQAQDLHQESGVFARSNFTLVISQLEQWEAREARGAAAATAAALGLETLSAPQRPRLRRLLHERLAAAAPGPYTVEEQDLIEEATSVLVALDGADGGPDAEEVAAGFAGALAALRRRGDPPARAAQDWMEQVAGMDVWSDGWPDLGPDRDDRTGWSESDEQALERLKELRADRAQFFSRVWREVGRMSPHQAMQLAELGGRLFGLGEGLRGPARDAAEDLAFAHTTYAASQGRVEFRAAEVAAAWDRRPQQELRDAAGPLLSSRSRAAAANVARLRRARPWSEEIPRLGEEAEAEARRFRDWGAAVLGVEPPRGQGESGAREEALWRELVESVALAGLLWDAVRWKRDVVPEEWLGWARAGFEKLRAAGAFATPGDLRVAQFRAEHAASFAGWFGAAAPAAGHGATAERVRQHWLRRGRDLIGAGRLPDAELDAAFRAFADELAQVVGRHDATVAAQRTQAEAAARAWALTAARATATAEAAARDWPQVAARAATAGQDPAHAWTVAEAGLGAHRGLRRRHPAAERLWLEDRAAELARHMLGEDGPGRDLTLLAQALEPEQAGPGEGVAGQCSPGMRWPLSAGAPVQKWVADVLGSPADLTPGGFAGLVAALRARLRAAGPAQFALWEDWGRRVLGEQAWARLATPWLAWLSDLTGDPAAADWLARVLGHEAEGRDPQSVWRLHGEVKALLDALAASKGSASGRRQRQEWLENGRRLLAGLTGPDAAAAAAMPDAVAVMLGYRAGRYLGADRVGAGGGPALPTHPRFMVVVAFSAPTGVFAGVRLGHAVRPRPG
ncbi:hypothetical protein ACFXPA_41785, partial [Amycolatopsis sp. NPDC059090]|uniref:hypothetical protein n=1 Tax=Amycolatopsis sp. NPDC059090 TaxID=3346723 RepID=UPI00366DCEFD